MGPEVSPIEWHKDETLRLGIVVDWPLENPPSSGRWPDHLYAHLADDGADHGFDRLSLQAQRRRLEAQTGAGMGENDLQKRLGT